MYELINDIESYPSFVPGCTAARVVSRKEGEVVATLQIKRGPLKAEFTTRNLLEPSRRVLMQLVSGPFRHLDGLWEFEDLGDGECELSVTLTFEVIASPLSMVFSMVFEELVRAQVSAFVDRADVVYGE